MRLELSDKFIRAITPPTEGRLEFSDTKRPGLRLRVGSSGRFSWLYERRVKGGRKMKVTLGTWPTMGLSAARKGALELEHEAMIGIDRMAEAQAKREEQARAEREGTSTFEVISLYATLHLATLKNTVDREQRRRNLERAFAAKADRPVHELTTMDCQAAIDAKLAQGKPVMANRLRAHLRHFTGWATRRGYLAADIGAQIDRPAKERPRDVVLSVDQVRSVFEAADTLGPVFGGIVKLLVLTGQRNAEIRELQWSEINVEARTITKRGAYTKNERGHVTHLSEAALQVVEDMQTLSVGGSFMFSFDGVRPPSSMGKAKRRLDTALGGDFPSWRLHDLRTAMATALAEAGFSEAVVDRILNHVAGGSAPSAVARVYQRGDLLKDRARALDAWAEMVTGSGYDKMVRFGATK
ncbi:tyrosine-type recombinase/integrase [Rhodobacterales bacterium HKCCSP123]|nr:tyrosine-type recombinase/integrase [Rhodobacterales bacterium HKCCSP123]